MTLRLLGHIELPAHRSDGGFDHADIHPPTDRLYVAHTSNDWRLTRQLIVDQANEGNAGNSRDFWSKSDSQRFGTPLISSTCRWNSLSRLTGNFVERIRNQKRDNCEPKTTEQRKLKRRQMASMLRGVLPVFLPEIFRPLSEPEKPHRWPVLLLQYNFIPPHTASSRQIKPSVVC